MVFHFLYQRWNLQDNRRGITLAVTSPATLLTEVPTRGDWNVSPWMSVTETARVRVNALNNAKEINLESNMLI